MIHPGDPGVARRLKSSVENGPWAQPWAGRKLHAAMQATAGMLRRLAAAGISSEAEIRAFSGVVEAALDDGSGVYAFTMFVAAGVRQV